ncbi:MAG: PilZ domain-containing protein [Sphingobium sp.]
MGLHKPLKPDQTFQLDLSARGYVVLFRPDRPNHCPGCGHSQWFVGRISAECGICGTALPLASEAQQSPVSGAGRKAVALHMVNSAPPLSSGRERRKEERIPASGRVLGLHIDGSPHAFRIEDISAGGVKGALLPGMEQATSLMIELEDGSTLSAELRWTDGEFAGLALLSPPTA